MTNNKEKASPLNYNNTKKLYAAVDCIIFGIIDNKLKLLIFKRELEPLAGSWSLIGSLVEEDEHVYDAAKRVLEDVTGLTEIYMEQLHCFGNKERDQGGRVISIAHWSFIKINQSEFKISKDVKKAKWVDYNEIPELIFDHNEMIQLAISRLREKARFQPVGFKVLPKEFTLTQLLHVYQAIFDNEIDNRNFRKKILKSGLLINLEKKDKSTSKKGSFLYSFNTERYHQLQEKGYNFNFDF